MNKLERHHMFWDVHPERSFEYNGFKVCIGEGGPKYEYTKEITKEDCPHGYYDTMYAILMGDKVLFEQPFYFDSLHYLKDNLTPQGAKKARLDSAEKIARLHIDEIQKELEKPSRILQ